MTPFSARASACSPLPTLPKWPRHCSRRVRRSSASFDYVFDKKFCSDFKCRRIHTNVHQFEHMCSHNNVEWLKRLILISEKVTVSNHRYHRFFFVSRFNNHLTCAQYGCKVAASKLSIQRAFFFLVCAFFVPHVVYKVEWLKRLTCGFGLGLVGR